MLTISFKALSVIAKQHALLLSLKLWSMWYPGKFNLKVSEMDVYCVSVKKTKGNERPCSFYKGRWPCNSPYLALNYQSTWIPLLVTSHFCPRLEISSHQWNLFWGLSPDILTIPRLCVIVDSRREDHHDATFLDTGVHRISWSLMCECSRAQPMIEYIPISIIT